MAKNNTKATETEQMTAENARALVYQIVRAGDDEAARALASLLMGLAQIESAGAREGLAIEAADRAYTLTEEYGNALLAFLHGKRSFVVSEAGIHLA